MRISKNKQIKVVQFWMTPEERAEEGIMDKVNTYFNELKEDKKYRPVVYVSGNANLTSLTADLLKRNHTI